MEYIDKIITLKEVLLRISDFPWNFALYIDNKDQKWSEESISAVLDPNEYDEDYDENLFAVENNLEFILEIADIKSIIRNLQMQKQSFSTLEIIDALRYYYENDAFLTIA